MSDNEDKPVLKFEVVDLDSVWAPPDAQGHVKIVFCTAEACEVALNVPPATLVKLEIKLAKLREMQAQMSGDSH